jgi:hypothetical protein
MTEIEKTAQPNLNEFVVGDFYDQGEKFYALTVSGPRAKVSKLEKKPGNHEVLGFGTFVETTKGPIFAAYFATSRDNVDAAPDYEKRLIFAVDGAIADSRVENVRIEIAGGFNERTARLFRGTAEVSCVKYAWPWHRELFGSFFSDPFGHRSRDFFMELSSMAKSYSPR